MSGADRDAKDFRLAGRSFRLRPQDFIDALKGHRPKPLQTWAVDVGGSLFPSKQVVALTTGFNDFTSNQANAVLRRFGFEPFSMSREGPRTPLSQRESRAISDDGDRPGSDVRVAALREAVRLVSRRPDGTADDALKTAETFERWLSR
jgi:hypothetical protein